jgi:transposase
MPAIQEE